MLAFVSIGRGERHAVMRRAHGALWDRAPPGALFLCRRKAQGCDCAGARGCETATFVNMREHPSACPAPGDERWTFVDMRRHPRTRPGMADLRSELPAGGGLRPGAFPSATPHTDRRRPVGFRQGSTAPRAFRVSLIQSSARPRAKARHRVARKGPMRRVLEHNKNIVKRAPHNYSESRAQASGHTPGIAN
jgi:hypothetical protein